MGNMSYYRFQNTLNDMRDVQQAMEDDVKELSKEEARARQEIIEICKEIAEEYGEGE